MLFYTAFLLASSVAAAVSQYTLCDNNHPCADPGLQCIPLVAGNPESVSVCGSAPSGTPFDCSVSDTPCCHDKQCKAGAIPGNSQGICSSWPGGVYCGGAAPPQINVCVYNECDANNKCPDRGSSCVQGGTLELLKNSCLPATCAGNADCSQGPAGQCRPFPNAFPPCGWDGLYCTYSDSACRDSSNCKESQICVYDHGKNAPVCVDPSPPPPVAAVRVAQ